MEKETKVAVQEETAVSTDVGTPMGFEDEEAGDMVMMKGNNMQECPNCNEYMIRTSNGGWYCEKCHTIITK